MSGFQQLYSCGNNRWDASLYKQVNCIFHMNYIYSIVSSSLYFFSIKENNIFEILTSATLFVVLHCIALLHIVKEEKSIIVSIINVNSVYLMHTIFLSQKMFLKLLIWGSVDGACTSCGV